MKYYLDPMHMSGNNMSNLSKNVTIVFQKESILRFNSTNLTRNVHQML